MCNFKDNLVAWMDGELSAADATTVEQHVAACSECRRRVSAYESVSHDFAACYAAATPPTAVTMMPRRMPRWVPLAVAAAAAVAAIVLLLPRKPAQPRAPSQVAHEVEPQARLAVATPAEAVKPAPSAARHRAVSHRAPQPSEAIVSEPTVRIAIPADAIYPPGAVPEGMAYFANVSFAADGSVQAYRLPR